MLPRGLNVLQHVESVNRIILAAHRARKHVMDKRAGERPFRIHPGSHVGNEQRVEISHCDLSDSLLDDACAECVSAPDLEYVLLPGEHFCDELVAGKSEGEPLGIVAPGLVDHQAEWRKAVLLLDVQDDLVLRLSGFLQTARLCPA